MLLFISGRNFSVIELPGGCMTEGRYQALYFNVNNNQSCLSSCYIVIEVMEVRLEALTAEFNQFCKCNSFYNHNNKIMQ